ncbi:hypothetical protein NDU88_007256 [Pleurodeles waltl]|uniref:Secreted protein n=1 Tax=Pleurodeles waltl TaxID=8319 RepID=A0AAV7QMG1_PLEWA|nr:hypothetical protein NDU88_007256 [Pleurodeles waltl]
MSHAPCCWLSVLSLHCSTNKCGATLLNPRPLALFARRCLWTGLPEFAMRLVPSGYGKGTESEQVAGQNVAPPTATHRAPLKKELACGQQTPGKGC